MNSGGELTNPLAEAQEHLEYAYAYNSKNDLGNALHECETAIELAPDLAKAHYLHSVILEKLNEKMSARAAYQEAVRLDPEYDNALQKLDKVSKDATSRGGCLTGLLVLYFIGNIGSIISLVGEIYRNGPTSGTSILFSEWDRVIQIILSVTILVFIVAIWRWKKWGVFALVTVQIVGTIVNSFLFGLPLLILYSLILLALFVVLIKPRWHLFK